MELDHQPLIRKYYSISPSFLLLFILISYLFTILSFSFPFGINLVPQNEPSSEALSSVATIMENSMKSDNESIQPPHCLCGRVINIVVWESDHWDLIKRANDMFGIGKFVGLRNVKEVSTIDSCLSLLHVLFIFSSSGV